MDLENKIERMDIIDALNAYVAERRKELGLQSSSFLVLLRKEESMPFSRGIKKFLVTLMFGTGTKGYRIFEESITQAISSEQQRNSVLRELNIRILLATFRMIESGTMDKIVKDLHDELPS